MIKEIKNTENARKLMLSKKADFIQVNFIKNNLNRVHFEKSKVRDFNSLQNERVFVSAWVGKKQGIAVSNSFSDELIKKAIKIAKCSENLEFFYGLPYEKVENKVKDIDGKEMSEEEILKLAEEMIIDLGKGEKMPEAFFDYSNFEKRVVNSLGQDTTEKSSLFSMNMQYVIEDKESVSYWDAYTLRKIPSKQEIRNISSKILEETRELRNPVKINEIPEIVVLDYNALAKLMEYAFLSNFNGLNVIKNRSILAGKQGERLFSEKFSLKDSGILNGGVASESFDDEGSPTKESVLIDKGILKGFIYDFNTARHLKKKSSGNSSGFAIDFNNVIVEKGQGLDLDNALIIKDVIGEHTSNAITTDFSLKSHGALLLERGERKAIRDVMITGKMFDAFRNIVALGKEIRNIGNVYLPKIAFKGIRVEKI